MGKVGAQPYVRVEDGLVLVVEEDPTLSRAIARLLARKRPWSVLAVSSATEARTVVDAASRRWVGFVLDVGLPEGGRAGIELAAHLGKRCAGVPIAVVTGFVDGGLANDVAALDATYVCKPPSTTALMPFLARVAALAATAGDVDRLAAAAAVEFGFTPREREVVTCAVRGDSVNRYCEEVGISQRTFRAHAASIVAKTGAVSLQDFAMTVLRAALHRREGR